MRYRNPLIQKKWPFISLVLAGMLLVCVQDTQGQSKGNLDIITGNHQACLDKGKDLLACSIKYYKEVDSLLNVSYQFLLKHSSDPGKAALKKEQLAWLERRDEYFHERVSVNQGIFGEMSRDSEMLSYEELTNFVKNRIRILRQRSRGYKKK